MLLIALNPFLLHATQPPNPAIQAYQAVIDLRLATADSLLNIARQQAPNDPFVVLVEDYIEFVELYLLRKDGAYQKFNTNQSDRLERIDESLDPTYYRYAQAEIHLHGAFADLMEQEYLSSFFHTRKAYKLLEEDLNRQPNFKPSQKSMALIKTLLGTIPNKFQFGLKLFGMHGSSAEGMRTLEQLSKENWLFQTESTIFYTMLLSHLEAKHDKAWDVLVANGYPLSGNLFTYFITADIALYSKHGKVAVTVVDKAPTGSNYLSIPMMQYLKGIAQTQMLDSNCIKTLNNFISTARGDSYKASAYQHMAWYALTMKADTAAYIKYMKHTAALPDSRVEADKMAQKESHSGTIPCVPLLKVRCLYDGGYYSRALALLDTFNSAVYNNNVQVEYFYRKARVLDDMGNDSTALTLYDKTITKGRDLPLYYAGNAALKAGEIYETQGNKAKAAEYYRTCLSISGHEYEGSLHQKARAGLGRTD